jgi:hypothetical protein
LARSRVWVTLSTSSVNLKNLSGIAIHGSTLLAIPHGSCPVSTLFASSINLQDFSRSANVWSTLFTIKECMFVFIAWLTFTINQKSLKLSACRLITSHSILSTFLIWWAILAGSVFQFHFSWVAFHINTLSSGFNDLIIWAWSASSINQ